MDVKIAICDDEPVQAELIKSYILSMDVKLELEFQCIVANSGEELLEKIKDEKIDIFFLDIQMSGINGIETAQKIREDDNEAIIVFMTGYRKYTLEAFELNAFHYLIKPIMPEKFRSLMKRVLRRFHEIKVHRENTKKFILKTQSMIMKIDYNDILYFEKNFRKIKMYTVKGNYDFYGSFKALLTELDQKIFVRCHQGFVVNKNKIISCNNEQILINTNGTRISVSRKYKNNIIRAIESIEC
ncbi:response regulator transcription factor [bacterium AH-315-G05]|nr:response regulator transcription factor [bacterium AH-315-G05]